MEIPIYEKYSLNIEQAAAYFGIGQKKLRWLVETNEDADFILKNGSKTQIKRKSLKLF